MASGIYSQSVNSKRALLGDPVTQQAELDRVLLQTAVMRRMFCEATGAILDTSRAALVRFDYTNSEGNPASAMMIMTEEAWAEREADARVQLTEQYPGGTFTVIKGSHYRKDGSLTVAEHAARTDALPVIVPGPIDKDAILSTRVESLG